MSHTSIILPVYNESQQIDSVFEEVRRFAAQRPDYRFLFVDDGSEDDTAARIDRHIAESPDGHIAILRCGKNVGKGRAIHLAAAQCNGDLICFTDGDLAYDLEHLDLLVEKLADHDVAIGSRALVEKEQANITAKRKLMGVVFNGSVRAILGLPFRDTQAGLKGFRPQAARAIFRRQRVTNFAFDTELLFLAQRLGYSVGEVPAHVAERHSYKVTTMNLFTDPIKMLMSVIGIRARSILGQYGKRHAR